MEFKTISASDFVKLLESGKAVNILDVRGPDEHAEKHLLAPHKHIPIDELAPTKLWGKDEEIYILCGGGKRATRAAGILASEGFEDAIVISGGLRSAAASGAELAGKDIKSAITCKSGS